MNGTVPPPCDAMIFRSGQRAIVSESIKLTIIRVVSAGYSNAGAG